MAASTDNERPGSRPWAFMYLRQSPLETKRPEESTADLCALQCRRSLCDIRLGDDPSLKPDTGEDREDRRKVDAAVAQLGEDAIPGGRTIVPQLVTSPVAYRGVDILHVHGLDPLGMRPAEIDDVDASPFEVTSI